MATLRIVARRASSSLLARVATASSSSIRPTHRPHQAQRTASTSSLLHVSRTPSSHPQQQQAQRRSFASTPTTLEATEDPHAQLELPITAEQWGKPVEEVLKASSPKLKPSNYLIALSTSNPTLPLSISDLIPHNTTQLTFYTFGAHPLAREAFWRTAAFVVAATLAEVHGKELRIAGSLGVRNEGGGGEGFALNWLVESEEEASQAAAAAAEEGDGDAVQQALTYASKRKAATPLSEAQLQQLASKAQKLASRDQAFVFSTCTRAEAREQLGVNAFKLEELAARYPNAEEGVRLVRLGEYVDLAPLEGKPLLSRVGALRNALFLSDSNTATYLPASPRATPSSAPSQILLRARGVAFPTKALFTTYLALQKAAQARDHRHIGTAQALFITSDVSPGTPFLLPHGTRLARKVERVVRDLYDVYGYDEVVTPLLMRKQLWERSGHWENYRADMFGVRGFVDVDALEMGKRKGCCDALADADGKEGEAKDEFGLKPMNCPGHCIVFASAERSYRDLPIRYAEFSPLHRNESSGSLSGLTRVRRFHQDDAHVFCTSAQISPEITSMLHMLTSAYRTFGFHTFELVLSTRPTSYIGTLAEWDAAEDALRQALDASGRAWSLNEADGAFYGPKIDVRLVDAAGRKHQTATIQLDFQLPQRFALRYADPSAAETGGWKAPVMIHRAILGSVERFMAILIEQTEGRWPFWLSPRQGVVLPVAPTSEHVAHAEYVRRYLALGSELASFKHDADVEETTTKHKQPPPRPTHVFHVDVDASSERFAKRIRNAALKRYNFVLVVGDAEVRNGTVSVRAREDVEQEEESGRPGLKVDMGEWKLDELRRLFCTLDSNHW